MLSSIHELVNVQTSAAYGLCLILVSVFLFWRSVRRSIKLVDNGRGEEEIEADARRWGFKVFDIMLFSFVGAILIARVSQIIVDPEPFREARWFWLPYEKIDGQVSLFSSLPWLFFQVWGAPLHLESLVLGWIVSLILLSRFTKIPWSFLSNAISDVFWLLFIGVELYFAVIWESWGPLAVVCGLVVLSLFRWRSNRMAEAKGSSAFHKTVAVAWKLSTITGLPVALAVLDFFYRDFAGRDFFVAVSILAAIIGLWVIARDLFEYVSILRYGAGVVLAPDIGQDETQSVMGSLSGNSGWRKYLQENPVKKSITERSTPRNFSKTYKDYVTIWERLWMKTLGKFVNKRKITDEPNRPISQGS